jgi:hypothetical protein
MQHSRREGTGDMDCYFTYELYFAFVFLFVLFHQYSLKNPRHIAFAMFCRPLFTFALLSYQAACSACAVKVIGQHSSLSQSCLVWIILHALPVLIARLCNAYAFFCLPVPAVTFPYCPACSNNPVFYAFFYLVCFLGCPRNSADTEFRGIFWLLKWFLLNSGEIPRNSAEFRGISPELSRKSLPYSAECQNVTSVDTLLFFQAVLFV